MRTPATAWLHYCRQIDLRRGMLSCFRVSLCETEPNGHGKMLGHAGVKSKSPAVCDPPFAYKRCVFDLLTASCVAGGYGRFSAPWAHGFSPHVVTRTMHLQAWVAGSTCVAGLTHEDERPYPRNGQRISVPLDRGTVSERVGETTTVALSWLHCRLSS